MQQFLENFIFENIYIILKLAKVVVCINSVQVLVRNYRTNVKAKLLKDDDAFFIIS